MKHAKRNADVNTCQHQYERSSDDQGTAAAHVVLSVRAARERSQPMPPIFPRSRRRGD
jgi:hypothetical protein